MINKVGGVEWKKYLWVVQTKILSAFPLSQFQTAGQEHV